MNEVCLFQYFKIWILKYEDEAQEVVSEAAENVWEGEVIERAL